MKKILLLILLLPVSVNAKTIYSNYQLIDRSDDYYYEESDLSKREEKILYQNYHYLKTNEAYFLLGENPADAPLIDEDDYLTKEVAVNKYEDWGVDSYTTHEINNDLKVRYLKLHNFNAPNTKINYVKTFVNDVINFFQINNSNYYFKTILQNNSQVILDLGKEVNLSDLKIQINFITEDLNNLKFDVSVSSNLISFVHFKNEVLISDYDQQYFIDFKNENIYEYQHYFLLNKTFYKYYNLVRVNKDIYTEKPLDGYYHDLDDYQKKYNYYQRDKVVINKEINNLDDLIITYTSSDVSKITNLDLSFNGLQKIEVCLTNGFCFDEEILVNIKKPIITEEVIKDAIVEKTQITKKTSKNIIEISTEPSLDILSINNNITQNKTVEKETKLSKISIFIVIISIILGIMLKIKRRYVESV